jgi:hypothetical protein
VSTWKPARRRLRTAPWISTTRSGGVSLRWCVHGEATEEARESATAEAHEHEHGETAVPAVTGKTTTTVDDTNSKTEDGHDHGDDHGGGDSGSGGGHDGHGGGN